MLQNREKSIGARTELEYLGKAREWRRGLARAGFRFIHGIEDGDEENAEGGSTIE